MKISKIYITAAWLLSLMTATLSVRAQDQDTTRGYYIGIIAKYTGDEVVLRWGANDNAAFFTSLQYGYKLERTTLRVGEEYQKLNWKNLGKFLPADSATWERRVDTSNSYQVIAAQAALGTFRRQLGENPNFISLMQRYEEESNLFGFAMMSADLDKVASELLGLRYVDSDVLPDAVYSYRITPLTPDTILVVSAGETFVETQPRSKMAPPELLEWGYENHVRLDWYTHLHISEYSAYYIERGDASGQNFRRMHKHPKALLDNPDAEGQNFQLTFIDSVPKDYVTYSYRIVGVDAFGDEMVGQQIVYSYGRDRTPPTNAYEVKAFDRNENSIRIFWNKKLMEKDFVGYNILKSGNSSGPYTIINAAPLKPKTKEYIDANPDVMRGSFYRVEVIDTAGNRNWSLGVHGFLKDTEAPAKPVGLVGKCDSNGIVTLNWPLGNEIDIMGYRVFYNNQADHEMTNLTPYPVSDTTFTDSVTLASLTEYRFYQIVAVDRHMNHSERSEILEVQLPDTVPPGKPMFENILVTDTAIYLKWIPSYSQDVTKHIIYRKKGTEDYKEWQVVLDTKTKKITDGQVEVGEVYTYKIEALDDDENRSGFPKEVSGKIYDTGKRPSISDFNAEYDKDQKKMNLSWKYPASDQYHYVIYRSYNESTFSMYTTVDGVKNSFVDQKLLGAGTYTYAVRALYKNGGDSGVSEKKEVLLPTSK
jgi:hypothetical protein